MVSKLLICMLLATAVIGLDLKAQNSYDPDEYQIKCDPNLPTLKVGDYLMSSKQEFDTYKSTNKVFILAVSDSSCESCCQGEIILQQLREALTNDIKILRVDKSKYQGSLPDDEQLFIDSLPSIYLYYDGYYYNYNDGYVVDMFVDFMNRIMNPLVELNSRAEVDSFTDLSKNYDERPNFVKKAYRHQHDAFTLLKVVNRAIAFVSTPQEYQGDMKEYEQAAIGMFMRGELRLARCTDPELVKYYKQKMGPQWFSESSKNSIVLLKRHNASPKPETTFKYIDVGSSEMPYYHWINSNSLDAVEELSGQVYKIINMIKKPFFIAFLADEGQAYNPRSDELYAMIKSLAPRYPNIQFTYTRSEFYKQKKEALGVTWKDDPAFTFVFGAMPGQAVAFPEDNRLDEASLVEFINKAYDGSIIPKPPKQPMRTFEDVCLQEGVDVLLFIFDSSMDPNKIKEIGMGFGKAAQIFQELNAGSVKLTQFDSRGLELPDGIGPREALPQVLFFPAYHKEQPYVQFTEFTTKEIMLRVQAQADIKFSLPDNFEYTKEELNRFERANDL